MGGCHDVYDRKAGLTSCDKLNVLDNLELLFKGIFYRFSKWKLNYPEWDFGCNDKVSVENFNLMKSVWLGNHGYIGKKICQHYGIIYHEDFSIDNP